MARLPRLMYSQCNPYKNPIWVLTTDFKTCMEIGGTRDSQDNLEKEQSWRIHTSWIKSYCKATVPEAGSSGHEDRHTRADRRTDGSVLSPGKAAETVQRGKQSPPPTAPGQQGGRGKECVDPLTHTTHKNWVKMTTDPNVRANMMKSQKKTQV